MRVGFVAPGDLSTPTGGYVYDRKVIEALRHDHRAEVVTVPPGARGLKQAAGLALRSRLGVFDAVIQDGLCSTAMTPVNPGVEAPVVSIVHLLAKDDPREGVVSRMGDRAYLRTVDSCVYTSVAARRSSPSDGRSVVAHPASRFSPDVTKKDLREETEGDGEGRLRVAFVGDISPVKGLDSLVRAASEVPGCRVTVAGRTADESYERRVRKLCSSLGVSDRVEFLGALSKEGLASVFRRSDVVAVPSVYEAFGTAYIEGMSFGLPAVAPAAGGPRELITDGRNGFLIEDEDDLVRSLRILSEKPGVLAEMGVEALRTESRWVNWEETALKIIKHIEDTVG